jgi:hypothetical protein
MADQNTPTTEASSDDSLSGTMVQVLRSFLLDVDDCLPVTVISYDRNENRATVAHEIQMVETGGAAVDRAQVISVPALVLGAGGFMVGFHIPPGSKGWIKATDRDLSNFLETYEKAVPDNFRIHNFDTGLFIPDVMTGYTIAGEDEEAMVIQSMDGLTKISINNDRLKIVHPTLQQFETETLEINATTEATLTTPQFTVDGKTDLGSAATLGIARKTDAVEVTIPAGTFLVSADAGVLNPLPVVVTGTITAASTNNRAD